MPDTRGTNAHSTLQLPKIHTKTTAPAAAAAAAAAAADVVDVTAAAADC